MEREKGGAATLAERRDEERERERERERRLVVVYLAETAFAAQSVSEVKRRGRGVGVLA